MIASGFVNPVVSKAEVRAQILTDLQSAGLNDTNVYNRFEFSTVTVKAEETPRCSLFTTASVVSPVRSLPGEFTPIYFQTSSFPIGNIKAVNSVHTDHQSAGQVAFSCRSSPKMKIKEFADYWSLESGMARIEWNVPVHSWEKCPIQ